MSKHSDETVAAIDALTRRRMMRGIEPVIGNLDEFYLEYRNYVLEDKQAGRVLASVKRHRVTRRLRWNKDA
jgi:hypothetical protein